MRNVKFLKLEQRGESDRLEDRLTDGDRSYHWGHDDRERHPAGDHQVPLVVGDVLALIAVVDLTERREAVRVTVKQRKQIW